jgi:hypothetical protein
VAFGEMYGLALSTIPSGYVSGTRVSITIGKFNPRLCS